MRNSKRIIIVLTLLLPFVCSSCAVEYEPLFPCSDIINNPYGICCHISRYEFDSRSQIISKYKDLGSVNMRTDWDWGFIEPKIGKQYSWHRMDIVYNDAKLNGIELLPIINEETWNNNFAWDYIAEWEKYIKATVVRYNDINHWEICNEIDLSRRLSIDSLCIYYPQMLNVANRVIKKVSSTKKTIISGFAHINSNISKRLLKNIKKSDYDILNFHMYTGWGGPERFIDTLQTLKRMMAEYHCIKPVWITETGYSNYHNANKRGYENNDVQSEYIARTYLICLSLGVERIFWYQFGSKEEDPNEREHHWGLVHNDLSPKNSYKAYKALTSFMPNGSERPKLYEENGYYKADWINLNRKHCIAIWTKEGEIPMPKNLFSGCKVYDMYGNNLQYENLKIRTGVTYIIQE